MSKFVITRLLNPIQGLLSVAILIVPLLGCSSEPPEKSPDEIEKGRQEHIQRTQRELQGD